MKINVIYDKYNTKIKKATLIFDSNEEEQYIEIEIDEVTSEGNEGEPTIDTSLRVTSIDADGVKIENLMSRNDLRTLLLLIRNILNQI